MMPSPGTAYLAPEGYEEPLRAELEGVTASYGRLLLTDRPPQPTFWAQNIWYDPLAVPFTSIGEAAALLKGIQRNWVYYPFAEHRRAALIAEKLPHVSNKQIVFPSPLPTAPLGSWTLLDKHTLLAAGRCSSPYRHGEVAFAEERQGPPSRAYLKLWEALTLLGHHPSSNDRCLEIGASPGGWTWVLAHLGAEVLCIDRSPLDPAVAAMPNVHFQSGNAFAMTPTTVGPVDWIFSDVACYPEKLLAWVQLWLDSGLCHRFVCTLKFQGSDSYASAQLFANIPGSRVLHLSHNKHELTWLYHIKNI